MPEFFSGNKKRGNTVLSRHTEDWPVTVQMRIPKIFSHYFGTFPKCWEFFLEPGFTPEKKQTKSFSALNIFFRAGVIYLTGLLFAKI